MATEEMGRAFDGESAASAPAARARGPEFIALLAGLMALNAAAIDILLPAFPSIASGFGIANANSVQFILLAYLIGFGGAQLVFGPVSDRYGRRIPLFVGIVLYVACALGGAMAPSFGFLLAARFLQGVGAAATRIIAMSVVRDTQHGREMASTMSLVMMIFMIVPIIAPFLGQTIILFGEWHLIFLFMAVVGTMMLVWTMMRLPETLPVERRRPLDIRSVASGFAMVLSNRVSLCYVLATAFYFASLYAFLNMAQPIYVDIYGLGTLFPVAFAGVAVLMSVTSFANSRLVVRFGQRRLSHAALIAYVVLTLTLGAFAATGPVPFWLFMTLFALTMPLFGWVGANFNSIALEPLGAVAGTASSVLGFTQTVGGGLIGAAIGQAYDGTILPLVAGDAIVAIIALAFVLIGEKGRLFGTLSTS